jgi:dTDP-glucose 4,6-dehydratase
LVEINLFQKQIMKKVLITGAAGFLGSHLCDRFIKEGLPCDRYG